MTSNVHKRMKSIHDDNRLKNLNTGENPQLGPIPIWVLSDEDIIDEWNKAIKELSQKEKKLLHVKDEYSQKNSISNMLMILILKNFTVERMMIQESIILK